MDGNSLTPKKVYPMIPNRMMEMFITMVRTGLLILMVERFIGLGSKVQILPKQLLQGNRSAMPLHHRSKRYHQDVNWSIFALLYRSAIRFQHRFPWPCHFPE